MIGRPTVQPNCQYSIKDYLYDALADYRAASAGKQAA
jgi:hypothetical protein